MKKADDLFYDLENFRTPSEMEEYFLNKRNIIDADKEYSDFARLKKGLFKKFIEEFYPLYCFSQSRYCKADSQMKIVLGNQGYDAIIQDSSGTENQYEITSYIDGKFEYEDAIRMNESGIGDIRFKDILDLDSRSLNYLSVVLKNYKKKSEKDYTGVNIIMIVNTFPYFEVYNNNSRAFVDLLIAKMSEINIKANKGYLMIFNDRDIKSINENIYEVK